VKKRIQGKHSKKPHKTKAQRGAISQLLFADAPRQGKDELNLANFPITPLTTTVRTDAKSLRFQDTIRGRDGKLVKRTWLIQGGSEVGLPTAIDEDVYVALMELTQRQGFENQKVLFSRYDLVKRLGWCPCGKCYQRLEESLVRLSNVTFHARNAFWDNEKKSYVTAGFTLIQGYHIYEEIPGPKTERDQPYSWIMWSDQLHRSFKSGYLKFLDTNLFFSLRTPLARRLYRYLDRKFGEKDQFMIDLFELAHEHLGMSRNFQFTSEIIRKLEPGLNELVEKLHLESWEIKDRIISFLRSPGARHEPFDTSAEDFAYAVDLPFDSVRVIEEKDEKIQEKGEGIEEQAARFAKMLIERGVAPKEARKLVQSHLAGLDKVQLAIEYFDSLMAQGSHGIKNPGGFLVSLIRDGNFQAVAQAAHVPKLDRRLQELLDEMAYNDYVEGQVDQHIAGLAEGDFAALVEAKKQEFLASDKASTYRKWKKEVFDEYATVFCRKDIAAGLGLPDVEAWRAEKGSMSDS